MNGRQSLGDIGRDHRRSTGSQRRLFARARSASGVPDTNGNTARTRRASEIGRSRRRRRAVHAPRGLASSIHPSPGTRSVTRCAWKLLDRDLSAGISCRVRARPSPSYLSRSAPQGRYRPEPRASFAARHAQPSCAGNCAKQRKRAGAADCQVSFNRFAQQACRRTIDRARGLLSSGCSRFPHETGLWLFAWRVPKRIQIPVEPAPQHPCIRSSTSAGRPKFPHEHQRTQVQELQPARPDRR